MGVLDWLYKDKKDVPKDSGEMKTGSVEKAAAQLSEQKKRQKRADCARQAKEYDAVTNKCI